MGGSAHEGKRARAKAAVRRPLRVVQLAHRGVLRLAGRLRSDAQDAVAEVFLTAWRRLDELPEGDDARVWLYATARRVIANQRRSSRRRVALEERLAREAASGPQATPAFDGEEALVHEALRRLGRRDREVLLLAEWENLSAAQIGAVLGCLTVTARGRLHRARRRFRAVFEELHADSEPNDLSLLRPAAPMRPRTTAQVREGGS